MDYQALLQNIHTDIKPLLGEGKVASYIPALASADPHDFAMSLHLVNGESYHVGLYDKSFSIQSISKVFLYALALKHCEEKITGRVNVEPSGNPFNSLVQLEYENGIPRNPFINPGAIVISDLLISRFGTAAPETILTFIQECAGSSDITFNETIAASEYTSGYRNFALANLMKSFKNIDHNVEEVLQTYFYACSISSTTSLLARAALFLANGGTDPLTQTKLIEHDHSKRINALMLTCGHYDASGDFAYRIGLPGKSGVGGGIIAIVPNIMSIAVYSPALNTHGNSLIGTKALEYFAAYSGHSIF